MSRSLRVVVKPLKHKPNSNPLTEYLVSLCIEHVPDGRVTTNTEGSARWQPVLTPYSDVPGREVCVSTSVSSTISDWEDQQHNNILYNIRLRVESATELEVQQYPAHAVAADLAACSDFFKRQFIHSANGAIRSIGPDGFIHIGCDVPQQLLHLVIRSLYSRTIELDTSNIEFTLMIAQYLQLRPVIDACASYLFNDMLNRYNKPKTDFVFHLGQLILTYNLGLFDQLANAITPLEWYTEGLIKLLDWSLLKVHQAAELIMHKKSAGAACESEVLECIANVLSKRQQLLHLVDFSAMHPLELESVLRYSKARLARPQHAQHATQHAQQQQEEQGQQQGQQQAVVKQQHGDEQAGQQQAGQQGQDHQQQQGAAGPSHQQQQQSTQEASSTFTHAASHQVSTAHPSAAPGWHPHSSTAAPTAADSTIFATSAAASAAAAAAAAAGQQRQQQHDPFWIQVQQQALAAHLDEELHTPDSVVFWNVEVSGLKPEGTSQPMVLPDFDYNGGKYCLLLQYTEAKPAKEPGQEADPPGWGLYVVPAPVEEGAEQAPNTGISKRTLMLCQRPPSSNRNVMGMGGLLEEVVMVGEPCDISLGFCTDVTDIVTWREQQVVFESKGKMLVTVGAGIKRTSAPVPRLDQQAQSPPPPGEQQAAGGQEAGEGQQQQQQQQQQQGGDVAGLL